MAKRLKRSKRTWKDILLSIVVVIAISVGIGLLAYPTVSNWWNEMHQSRAIAGYTETVESYDEEELARLLDEARKYNRALVGDKTRFSPSDEMHEWYESLLDVAGNGIIGYIQIPSIKVALPIYHGTRDAVLQVAIGHVEGSSLPVGGKGTHVALSGHCGLPSARLFTDLDKLEIGDTFKITVLNEELTYQIDQIEVVLPDDMSLLEIDENEDYITLITCTPYGINSHRLLVRGTRVES